MRDLKRFTGQLEAATEALEPADSRLSKLADLVSASEYGQAADLAVELFDESHWDIRAITATMMAHYQELGFSGVEEICQTLESLIATSLSVVEPARRREQFVDRQLDWLFSTMRAFSEYHEKKETPVVKAWMSGVGLEQLDSGVAALGKLQATLPESFDGALGGLAKYTEWFRSVRPTLVRRQIDADSERVSEEETGIVSENKEGDAPRAPRTDTVELTISPPLASLLAKLDAFEKLTTRKRYKKAALVSADLRKVLSEFDPREYFPELFAQYSAQLSENVSEIAPFWDRLDEIEFQVLHEFYRVDLARFVEAKESH